jgi:hypothetical protein
MKRKQIWVKLGFVALSGLMLIAGRADVAYWIILLAIYALLIEHLP